MLMEYSRSGYGLSNVSRSSGFGMAVEWRPSAAHGSRARGAGRGARGAGRGARGAERGARNNTPHCTTCHFYTDSYRLTTGGCIAIAVSATVGSDAVRSLVLKCARPASRVPRLASRTFGPIALKSHVSTRDVAFLGLARRMHAFHIASGPVHSAPAIAAARTAWRHPPPGIAGGHFLYGGRGTGNGTK